MQDAFTDKVVWITGASSGIGRAMALEAARQGANVAVSARRLDRLHALVKEIEALGRRAVAVQCDVVDEDEIRGAVTIVVDELGRLDVAIANAGFGITAPLAMLTAADWRRQFDTNVVGAAMTARYALPHLLKTGGRLGLIGSVAAFAAMPTTGCYNASKAAVRSLGQTMSAELHGSGVSCTLVHPGFVQSEIAQVDRQGNFDPNRPDPRPRKLMWPTDRAAYVTLRAIHKRKREYVFTGHGKLGAFFGMHFPGILHFFMARVGNRMAKQAAGDAV